MLSTWMESNCECFLWQLVRYLKGLVDIVPYLNTLILGAGDNELLPDAHIKSCNLLSMALAMHKVKFWLLLCSLVLRDIHSHDLLVFGDKVNVVFLGRESHGRDREVHIWTEGALGVR